MALHPNIDNVGPQILDRWISNCMIMIVHRKISDIMMALQEEGLARSVPVITISSLGEIFCLLQHTSATNCVTTTL